MAKEILRNIPESEAGEMAGEIRGRGGKSRREALAVLAKHAAYTAPAVLTIVSLSAQRATAGSGMHEDED
jgi:hypothetical protein